MIARLLAGALVGAALLPAPALADGSALFATSALLPGDRVTGHVTVPAVGRDGAPFVRAVALHDRCLDPCTASSAPLSSTLQLLVQAPDGQTWQGTPRQLESRTLLPGGPLSRTSRTYAVTLSLPASVTNADQDRSLEFRLQWGLLTRSGAVVVDDTDAFPSRGGGSVVPKPLLPFTGADIALQLVVGGSFLASGALLVVAGRRRWSARRP